MTPWRAASRAYYAHHVNCQACIGAGQQPGTQARCEDGAALWQAYQDAPLPWIFNGGKRPGGAVLGAKSGAKSAPAGGAPKSFR